MYCGTRSDREAAEGLLLIDKPTGPTSHDIVVSVRRLLGLRKVGHAGTLDPLASGLLVMLVGRATKLAPFLDQDPKVYEGSFVLGLATDSLDVQGRIIHMSSYRGGREEVENAFASLKGRMEQLPPMYSAVKHKGTPLHRYARRGVSVTRKSREIEVYRAEITGFREGDKGVEADFIVSCSPGTYVRSLVSEVGETLDCGAALSRLRRVSSGTFHVRDALTLQELAAAVESDMLPLIESADAVDGLKKVRVLEKWVKAAINGAPLEEGMTMPLEGEVEEGDTVAVTTPQGTLIGLHTVLRSRPYSSKPHRII